MYLGKCSKVEKTSDKNVRAWTLYYFGVALLAVETYGRWSVFCCRVPCRWIGQQDFSLVMMRGKGIKLSQGSVLFAQPSERATTQTDRV
jgi:hypothetical protein